MPLVFNHRILKYLPVFFVLLFSCKKNEKQFAAVDMQFQAVSSGSDYALNTNFTNGDGLTLKIEMLQFYISDVRLVTKKDKEVLVEDIALIKLDANGEASMPFKVPAGDYKAIRFGIGVPEDLNNADPSDFNEANHPLNVTQNTYWGMNGMYRFIMLDGRYDIEGDGITEGTFSYHTGYDESYREVELAHDFSYKRKESYTEQIDIDVEKFFYVTGSMVNILTEPGYHGSTSTVELSYRVSDNFKNSISIH